MHLCLLVCILAKDILDKIDFDADIRKMLRLRRTIKVEDAEEFDQRLWEWYGLDLMMAVSRSGWPWGLKSTPSEKLMHDCVSEGDEALALQVLNLRGDYYKKLYKEGMKQQRGRKKRHKGKEFCALQEKISIYAQMHAAVKGIRQANKTVVTKTFRQGYTIQQLKVEQYDKLGWCKHLQTKYRQRRAKKASVEIEEDGEDVPYFRMELPIDDFGVSV